MDQFYQDPHEFLQVGEFCLGEGILFFLHASANVQEEIQMLVKKNSKNPFLIDQNYT